VNGKTSSGKTTGLYRRGQVWWWNFQQDGHRVRLSLETSDHAEAVRKVLDYRAKPHPMDAGRWEFEVDQYLLDQRVRGRLSPTYAQSRRYVLMRFAKDTGIEAPREVNVRMIQRCIAISSDIPVRWNSDPDFCKQTSYPEASRYPFRATYTVLADSRSSSGLKNETTWAWASAKTSRSTTKKSASGGSSDQRANAPRGWR